MYISRHKSVLKSGKVSKKALIFYLKSVTIQRVLRVNIYLYRRIYYFFIRASNFVTQLGLPIQIGYKAE